MFIFNQGEMVHGKKWHQGELFGMFGSGRTVVVLSAL